MTATQKIPLCKAGLFAENSNDLLSASTLGPNGEAPTRTPSFIFFSLRCVHLLRAMF